MRICFVVALMCAASAALAEHEGKMQVVLLGDSSTECSVPRRHEPKFPMFEEAVRLLLASHGVTANVINSGVSGEYIQRLLDKRYDKDVKSLPGVDYIFIRYGLNDNSRREKFVENYPKDYHELLDRLRHDHPRAALIVMSAIPMGTPEVMARINGLNLKVAQDEKLPYFDIAPRWLAELEKQGPNALNYRRFDLTKIPENLRPLAEPFVVAGKVEVMDNRLDGIFGDLPGWYGDRHPNLAGYSVIADETVKYLVKMMGEKK